MNTINIKIFSTLALSLLLTACGGGSDSDDSSALAFTGNDSPAVIDETNVEEIGKTSGEAILQASYSSSLPSAIVANDNADLDPVHEAILDHSRILSSLPSGLDVSAEVCTGGGSASTNTPVFSGRVVLRITYDNCTLNNGSDSFTIDGKVIVIYEDVNDQTAGFSMEYRNVTVSGITDESAFLNYTISCTNLSDSTTCTTSSVFSGSDGRTHQISSYEITGSSSTGFNGSATFSHFVHGRVSITVSNLTYGSCGDFPDGGSISFSSTTGTSGSIVFNADCSVTTSFSDGSISVTGASDL